MPASANSAPSFLNPGPLLQNGPPSTYANNTIEEAYLVFQNIGTLWTYSKVAMELTTLKYGKK